MSDMTSAVAIDLLDNLIGMIEDNQENDYDEAFRMAINALKAQDETHDKRTETHACDCIERQAAIDAILAVTGNSSVRELYEHVQEHGLSEMWSGGVNAAIDIIIAVPSAQPDSKETSSTHKALDTIDRQSAIDALWKALYDYEDKTEKQFQESKELDVSDWIQHRIFVQNMNDIDRQTIIDLPSAQPEQRWIPVDLRNNSPEENKVVLLGVRFRDDFKYFVTSRQDYNYWIGLGREIKGELKWQPLPEPYRAERKTDERQT